MVNLREILGCLKCKLRLHCSNIQTCLRIQLLHNVQSTVRAWVTEICVMLPISDSFHNLSF